MPCLWQHDHNPHQTIRGTNMRKPPPNPNNDHKNQTEMTTATEARNTAIKQVATNTDPDWWNKATDTVITVARNSFDFTTDDIWKQLATLPTPHEPRALGAVMIAVQRAGLIRPTDKYRQSTRPQCHARPIRVWQAT